MKLIRETNAQGVVIEYVEFESVPMGQVEEIHAELEKRRIALNARQAASPAKVAAAYTEVWS